MLFTLNILSYTFGKDVKLNATLSRISSSTINIILLYPTSRFPNAPFTVTRTCYVDLWDIKKKMENAKMSAYARIVLWMLLVTTRAAFVHHFYLRAYVISGWAKKKNRERSGRGWDIYPERAIGKNYIALTFKVHVSLSFLALKYRTYS